MCTAISCRGQGCLFGRNLDIDASYGEEVVITPKNFRFPLKNGGEYRTRYRLMGMAVVMEGRPAYYEAMNDRGLAMAALNFPESAVYHPYQPGMDNIALCELLPWVLGQAENLAQAKALLERLNICNPEGLPTAPQHFMLGDRTGTLVAEPVAEGLKLYDNPFNVMTNEPPFPYHMWNLRNYRNLTREPGENRFSRSYALDSYGVGMGSLGLPGDASSASRFVRAAFNLENSVWGEEKKQRISQFFHVLDSVAMLPGPVLTKVRRVDLTTCSCCMDLEDRVYYYTTWGNRRITAVPMDLAQPGEERLVRVPLRMEEDFCTER